MSNRFLKGSLLSTTIIAGLVIASPANAQDANVAAAAKDQTPATQECPPDQPNCVIENPADVPTVEQDDSQAIVVTGSRIVSPNITSLAPVQVIGETDIDQSGAINVQDVLLENPVFGTPGISRTNSAFSTSGAGVATVDLRDLGSDRTLVLINSRRVVSGLPGSATVDLNVIPTQFVERIDILTGGASSLYGSDAVAGVVNFLYKRNFSGLLAEAQYNITERGDSAQYQVNMTGGGNFADDRGNVMIHLGYTNQKGLLSRNRKDTRLDDFDLFRITGDPDDFGTESEPFLSSFAPQGRFFAGPGQFTFSQDGDLLPCFSTNGTSCGGAPNGFNRQFFRTLAVPVERYIFATRGTFDITDNINAIAEATYVKTTSSREIEPFALASDDITTSGQINIETLVDGVALRNPFVPDAIFNAAVDEDGDGLRDIFFTRRLAELGTRNSEATRDFYRVVAGLEGTLLNDRFNWDVTNNYGQTSEQQTSNGQPNTLLLRSALAGIPDVDDVNNNGSTTDVVCADPIARAQGCVPINVFGFGSISPAAASFVAAEQSLQTRLSQQVWAANLSGALFELPAGPLGVAIGAEYRKETSRENNDALTNAGLNAGNALPDTSGSFNVKEVYGEINVPILRDVPFFQALNVRAAGRLSDYSTVGSVKTYSLGADWTPIEAVRVRGTYAKAVRAPNIGELFTGPSQTFPTGLADPCEGIGLTGDGALGDNCRAAPGVLANIAANGVFTLNQADEQGVSGFNSGNPELDVERSRSITAGIVINPRQIEFLRNFVFSADYYNIKIKDAIVAVPRQFILDQCFSQNDQALCSLITRRPAEVGPNSAGSISFINNSQINGGELKVEGLDFVASYRTSLNRFMNGLNMNARVAWTHILENFVVPLPGADEDPFDGEIGTARDRVNGTIGFSTSKVGLSFTGTYISKSFEDDQFLAAFDLEDDAISVPGQFYLDAQATFTPARKFEFFVGVDNALDNDAPPILSGTTFNSTGTDTAPDVYDLFGRRYYAGVRLRL